MGGRRAGRQDARHRRARAHRQARGPAGAGVRHAPGGLRPVRFRRPRSADERSNCSPRRARGRAADFVTIHVPKTKETTGLFGADCCAKAKPGLRIVNVARGGIVDEQALADAIRERVRRRRRARRVRQRADDGVAAVRARLGRRHAAPRGQHPRGPGQGRRHDRRAWCSWRSPATSCRSRSTSRGRGHRDGAAVPAAGRAPGPAVRVTGRRRAVAAGDRATRAQIADYDTRILTLAVLKGLFGGCDRRAGLLRQRPAARRRDAASRSARSSRRPSADYVNLITLRGGDACSGRHARRAARASHRIVMVDDHTADVPPADAHAGGAQRRPPRHDRHRRHAARRGRRQHRRHGRRPSPHSRVRR